MMRTSADVVTSARTRGEVDPEVEHRLTHLVRTLASRRRLHHVTLAVSDADGRRTWTGRAGPASTDDENRAVPVEDTPFFIASITKRFIVTLLLQAHERGEIGLDAPIPTLLPASVTAGLHRRRGVDHTDRITVRHLASHTSGLPDHFEGRRGGPSTARLLRDGQDTTWTFADVLETTRAHQRPHFTPADLSARRRPARYSDTGFQLLVRILEDATTTAFPDLITERIIGPLGLTRTWHPVAGPPAPGLPAPLPLHRRRRPVDVPGILRSSNDLISTTSDLLTFERALTDGALFRDPATPLQLTERTTRLRDVPVLRYGLGTMVFGVNRMTSPNRQPVTLVGHSGSTGTWLFTCPELGISLAGSVDQTRAQGLPFRIMARCLRAWYG